MSSFRKETRDSWTEVVSFGVRVLGKKGVKSSVMGKVIGEVLEDEGRFRGGDRVAKNVVRGLLGAR